MCNRKLLWHILRYFFSFPSLQPSAHSISSIKNFMLLHELTLSALSIKHDTTWTQYLRKQTKIKINGEILPARMAEQRKGKNQLHLNGKIYHKHTFSQAFHAEPLSMIDITYGGLLFFKAFHVTDCTNHPENGSFKTLKNVCIQGIQNFSFRSHYKRR